ncbi:hypothetical protein HYQ44_009933 [Verticillium longisporum]|nr:hypothetical protein HYQ44_009933 [Verticillium longisporum]
MDRSASRVRFSDHIAIQTFEVDDPHPKRRKTSAGTMAKRYSRFEGAEVTETVLEEAAKLFSEHYGIWGKNGVGKPGSRVKMSPARLRSQCLPDGSRSSYIQVTIDGALAGNAFACRWKHEGRQVCWVTQLVVHSDYRERQIATSLLLDLIDPEDDAFGIMSSHPAACKALAKAVGDIRFADVALDFAQAHAAGVMAASPIEYIQAAKLRGSLFDSRDTGEMVSAVDSGFYVDHDEPLEALAWFKANRTWPLGDLPDGHEFLFSVGRSTQRRSRSASTQSGKGSQE